MGVTKSGTDRYSIYLLIVGVAMVLATVVFHSTSFVHGAFRLRANEVGPNGTISTTANLINIGIEHLNFTCIHIGVHSSFFLITLTREWKTLWNTLALIEVRLKFNSTFYAKCKNILLVGSLLLFAVIPNIITRLCSIHKHIDVQFNLMFRFLFIIGLYYIFSHVNSFPLLGYWLYEALGHRRFEHFANHHAEHLLALLRFGHCVDPGISGTQRACFNRALLFILLSQGPTRTARKVAQKSHHSLRIGGIGQQMLRTHVSHYRN